MPGNFASGEEPLSQPGRNKGLKVLLDAHTNLLSAGSTESVYEGFIASINPRENFPFTGYNGLDIKPGTSWLFKHASKNFGGIPGPPMKIGNCDFCNL